ncbi:MAG: DUF222 domain-containing protein [Acidimicrobiia bacterium]
MNGSPIDLIREGREKLAVEDRSGWSAGASSDHMLAVTEEYERLGAELVRLTGEWHAIGAWGIDGFVSPAAWLSAHGRMTRPTAGRTVRSARHVLRFSATGDALADGRITTAKADLLAEAARGRDQYYRRDEEMLLDVASRLDVRDLAVALRTWRLLADDAKSSGEANDAFDRVHLDVANGLAGSQLAGFLDPHGSALLAHALDLIEPPDPTSGPDLPRTLSQRRGEGLVKLAQHYLDCRTDPDTPGRAVPSVTVVFTPELDRWMLEDHRCEIDGFGPVCFDTVSRLLCDARVAVMSMDERREVLDMGRETRTPTAAQRRAVFARDRHCQYPDCRAPARWCDVHHVVDWDHGGLTDLANLVLLCRRHHVAVHEGRKRLVRAYDGSIVVTPGLRVRGRGRSGARRDRRGPSARGDPDG